MISVSVSLIVNDLAQPVYSPVEAAPLDFALVSSRNQCLTLSIVLDLTLPYAGT